jgi:hypothetical protein
VHVGVLPNVEGGKVEAEGSHAPQHAAHVEQAGVFAPVRREAVGDQLEVAGELLDALVVARAALVGGAQALGNLPEEHAVGHPVVARRRGGAGAGNEAAVLLDANRDLGRHLDAAAALAQALGQRLRLEEVAIHDQLVVTRTALADGLRVHVRMPVHVASDPRAEKEHLGHVHRGGGLAEHRHERGLDLLVEPGNDLVDHLDQEEQHMLALVGDAQALARTARRLPARRELRAHALDDRAPLARSEARVEALGEQAGDALSLAQQRAARRLGGCGVKTGSMRSRPSRPTTCSSVRPRAFSRAKHSSSPPGCGVLLSFMYCRRRRTRCTFSARFTT